jgi:hypothetical protein
VGQRSRKSPTMAESTAENQSRTCGKYIFKPNSGSGIDLSWCDGFDKVSHVQEFGSLIGSPIR